MLIHNACIKIFGLHVLIVCVSEGLLSVLLYIYNVNIEVVGLHEQILCVSEGFLSC